MPLQATSGAASYDAFGGGVPVVPKYIEDYFSTYLVTGDGTAPAVNNGIDLSTKGGLVWTKKRSAAGSHSLFDTARGANLRLISNDTAAQDSVNLSFTTTGFSNYTFDSGVTYTSWSWAKAPKFFDVVTFTTSSGGGQTINHNLGATPGMMIVKKTSGTGDWFVWHRSIPNNALALNTTQSVSTFNAPEYVFGDGSVVVQPTSTQFTFYASGSTTYVAYLFAHNAGGFGLTGTDNVISCGSFSGNTTVTLGYEPQWIMLKRVDNIGSWDMHDVMRGWPVSGDAARLRANLSDAEGQTSQIYPNATGFSTLIGSGDYIYIAIRRGPMKVPTVGTTVFSPVLTATASETVNTVNFAPDMQLIKQTGNAVGTNAVDRLRGVSTRYQYNDGKYLLTSSTAAEASNYSTQYWNNTGFSTPYDTSGISTIYWTFKRAPSFFDEVCYIGTGSARTIAHNLTVAPELMIVKCRSTARAWPVYAAPLGNTEEPRLNESSASGSSTSWNSTTPTSSVFSVSNGSIVNASGDTYVAYLFATCAGVSKVGSYTGTATTLQVDCGFTGGARFVLIKRTDSTGDWYVWDTARGIVSGNDSYLLLNSTAAEVTNTDYIDTYSAGFEISSTAPAAINASGGSFIFFAVA